MLITALPFTVSGQVKYAFDHYSVEDGLSQSSVSSIIQDSKGFIWLGTLDGLNKFNGYEFEVFRSNPQAPYSIGENFTYTVFEDKKQNIWVGLNSAGVSVYNPNTKRFSNYTVRNGLSSNNVTSIVQDKAGRIWLGTTRGLNCFFDNEFIDLKEKFGLGRAHLALSINKIVVKDNILWGATNYGIFRFNLSTSVWQHYTLRNYTGLLSDFVNDIYVESNSKVYLATDNGICMMKMKGNDAVFVDPFVDAGFINPLINIRTTAIAADKNNVLWIGTENYGLYTYIPNDNSVFVSKKNPLNKQSLSSNTVLSLFVDKTNTVWIGTSLGGVNRLNRRKERFVTYRHNPYYKYSISANRIRCIYEDKFGKIWIGTEEGGFCEWQKYNNRFINHKHSIENPIGLSNNNVRSIVRDSSGIVWIGTDGGGLNAMNPENGKYKHYRYDGNSANSLPSDKIWKLYIDSKNNFWIGTTNGLALFDTETEIFHVFRNNTDKKSISGNHIVEIFEDSKQNLWIGTYLNGLNKWNPADSTFIRYPLKDSSIKIDRIYSIIEDSDSILWMGTRSALRKYNPRTEKFTIYNAYAYGFPNHVLMGILDDNNGNLWISTNAGIVRFNKETASIRSFRSNDGLQSEEYMIGAYCKLGSGELVFGGVNGMDVFKPENISDNPHIPDVLITSVKVMNRELKTDTAITNKNLIELNYEQNVISFDFVALNYQFSQKNKYAFMLEGFDEEWVECGTRRFANYTNLPPGKYTFRVIASNNDGIWNQHGDSICIHINAPFWRTKTFQVIALIFLVLMVYFIVKTRDFVRDKNKLEKIVQQRTTEILQQNEEIEAQRDEISVQRDIANQQKEEIETQRDELEKKQRELEKSYTNIRLLSRVGQSIIAHLPEEEIAETAYYRLIPLVRFDIFNIGLLSDDQNTLKFSYNYDRKGKLPPLSHQITDNNSITVWCFRNSKPVFIQNLQEEYLDYIDELPENLPNNNPRASIICVPLKAGEEHLGVISVFKSKVGAFRDYHLNVLRNLAIYITIALKNSRAYQQIEKQKQFIESKNDELQHLNATKDKFFSIVSHDLRNPFNSLINLTDMIMKRFDSYTTIQLKNFITDINKSSKEAYSLLDNLLNWSRSQTNRIEIKRENIDLMRIAEENIALITQAAHAKNIILKNEVEAPLFVFADFNTINTVVRNLLSNALKFTPQKGKIIISATSVDNNIEFSVKDTGVGISDEHLKKLFRVDVSHTTLGTSNEKGTGLGLILCYEFVQKNNGDIRVESIKGEGSMFTMILPAGNKTVTKTTIESEIAHTIKTEEITASSVFGKINIEPEKLQKIYDELKTNFIPLYKTVIQNNRIKEYIAFGDKLSKLGQTSKIEELQKFGQEISSKANCYDISGLQETICKFPDLVDSMQKHIEDIKD